MGRFNRDSRKIVLDGFHPVSVSKAIWPIKTRTNTPVLYNKSPYWNDSHTLYTPHAAHTRSHPGFATPPPSQQGPYKRAPTQNTIHPKRAARTHMLQAFRVTFSLLIAGLALALCILYSWTTLLILSLVCAILTLIMLHVLFDEEKYTIISDQSQPQYMHNTPYLLPARYFAQPQAPVFPEVPVAPVAPEPSPIPLSPTHSQPLEETQPVQSVQHLTGETPTFPTTPMPATPIVRVLETIDLSSTNVEHFLDIHDEWHNIPASQIPPGETLLQQGELPAEPPQEK